ncbi:hypothetical protein [Curtobacterium sp. MCBD17_030]|uniref:hypothetical protein n=1 Tax=Curtobacterium sp. MCBD17_030 TaxID=2175649 RepID=UPI000D919F15|nr:hypothetical protein [Curtobacterium sp. MCBD17_030]PYY32779.1 hypothetical protein DEI89_11920 [Curtobacterium sp. MCBD17_030]
MPKHDRVIATLLSTQVDLMNAAPTRGQVFKIGLEASSRIASWHTVEVPTAWFEEAVRAHLPPKVRGTVRVFVTSTAAAAGLVLTGLTASAVAGAGASVARARVQKTADDT